MSSVQSKGSPASHFRAKLSLSQVHIETRYRGGEMCTVGKWSKDKVKQSQTHANGCFGETYNHRTGQEANKFCMGQRKDSKISGILSVDGNSSSFCTGLLHFVGVVLTPTRPPDFIYGFLFHNREKRAPPPAQAVAPPVQLGTNLLS